MKEVLDDSLWKVWQWFNSWKVWEWFTRSEAQRPAIFERDLRREWLFHQLFIAIGLPMIATPLVVLAFPSAAYTVFSIVIFVVLALAFDFGIFALKGAGRWDQIERWCLRRAAMGEPKLHAGELVVLSCLASFVEYEGTKFVPSSMGRLTLTTQRLFYAPSRFFLPKTEGKSLLRRSIPLFEFSGIGVSDLNCSPEKGLMGARTFFETTTLALRTRPGRIYLLRVGTPDYFRECLEWAISADPSSWR
jgi:hypothetical protein